MPTLCFVGPLGGTPSTQPWSRLWSARQEGQSALEVVVACGRLETQTEPIHGWKGEVSPRSRAGGGRRQLLSVGGHSPMPRGHWQPPTRSAALLHFHPLIRYIYFLGISLTRIDCTIIAYFFGPLAVNLEARRAEAVRPWLSGLTPARAMGCHDNRDRCHPRGLRPPDGENRSGDGAAAQPPTCQVFPAQSFVSSSEERKT